MDLFVRILPFAAGGLAIVTLLILIFDKKKVPSKKSLKQ